MSKKFVVQKTVYKNKAHFPILSFSLINHSINNNVFAAITFYLRFVDIVVDGIQLESYEW